MAIALLAVIIAPYVSSGIAAMIWTILMVIQTLISGVVIF
jgi:hypothetical protein